ncbi:hypothetical protein AAEP93_009189 [Penicillium crustosum]
MPHYETIEQPQNPLVNQSIIDSSQDEHNDVSTVYWRPAILCTLIYLLMGIGYFISAAPQLRLLESIICRQYYEGSEFWASEAGIPEHRCTLSEQRIITAIEKVGLWESICRKGGLDATFNSLDWSYGERQLLALARALATPSPLLILDEATSGVDWETESRILEIIEQECAGQTVIAVMHRLRHIERFDKVALLQHVELVEFDAPRALLGRESEFRKLHTASHK